MTGPTFYGTINVTIAAASEAEAESILFSAAQRAGEDPGGAIVASNANDLFDPPWPYSDSDLGEAAGPRASGRSGRPGGPGS